MNLENELRSLLVDIAKQMYERRYVVATEGNVSARLDAHRILITPTMTTKRTLTEEQFVMTDMEGRKLEGEREPSGEIDLHLTVYRERPDVNAVIHAHPPMAVGLTVAGMTIATESLPRILSTFGDIPTAPYGTPTTPELAKTIEGLIRNTDALMLDKHGSLTVGRTLIAAYENLERLEWAAETSLWARLLGRVETLSDEQIGKLLAIRARNM